MERSVYVLVNCEEQASVEQRVGESHVGAPQMKALSQAGQDAHLPVKALAALELRGNSLVCWGALNFLGQGVPEQGAKQQPVKSRRVVSIWTFERPTQMGGDRCPWIVWLLANRDGHWMGSRTRVESVLAGGPMN